MPDIERRNLQAPIRGGQALEMRAIEENGATRIVGYAAVFNAWSEDLGGFRESIKPGAFANALKASDTRALINHDPNHVLGRVKSGTLVLREDDIGLWYEVTLPDTQDARDLITKVKRGDIDGNSFAFTVALDDWAWSGDTIRRVINEVEQLYDVGPVTYPAYPQTSASVRSRLSELQRQAPDVIQADGAAAAEGERQARFDLMRRRMALLGS